MSFLGAIGGSQMPWEGITERTVPAVSMDRLGWKQVEREAMAQAQAGDEMSWLEEKWSQFTGETQVPGMEDVAMAGIHPAAFITPAIAAISAGIGALLPVGPGGEVIPGAGSPTPGAGVVTMPGGRQIAIDGIPVGGPGVPEPPKYMIAKEWNVKVDSKQYGTFRMYYFMLHDGRCMSYHSPTKGWKIWKPKKHIVISSNPRVKMLSKLNRLNKRVEKMLKPYQPRPPRTKLVPSRALSSIERAALKA